MREAHSIAVATGDVGQALRLVVALREYAFRRIRYELMTWTDTAVEMVGAEQHALYPFALAIVAYGRFVRGELVEAVGRGRRAVEAAAWFGSSTGGLAERAIANAIFYLGKEHEALTWMDRMVEAAEAVGTPGHVAHALLHAIGRRDVSRRPVGRRGVGRAFRGRGDRVRQPDRPRRGSLRPGPHVREDRPGPLPRTARPERAGGGVGRQPLDHRVHAHREPVDPRPTRRRPRYARAVPRRYRHLVPRWRLGEPVAVAPARVRDLRRTRAR